MEDKEPLVIKVCSVPMVIELESGCWSCQGGTVKPSIEDLDNSETCGICHGKGTVLTRDGEAILELVRRHIT